MNFFFHSVPSWINCHILLCLSKDINDRNISILAAKVLVAKVQTATVWKGEVLGQADGLALSLATFSVYVSLLMLHPILQRQRRSERKRQ